MVGGHVTEPSVRRALALMIALLLVAVGLIAGTPSAQAIVPTSLQTFQGRFGSYNASTSFMTGPCSVAASSTINLPAAPAGATIDTAYLVWAASGNTADTTATLNGTPVSGVAVTDFFDPTEGYFQTRANITSLVTTAGGAFTIADITSATGAPWCTYSTVMKSATIYVFYEDPAEPVSQLNFYSGLEIVYGSQTTVNVSHGPLAPSATGEIEVLLYEGDVGLSGSRNGFRERFRVNGTVTSSGDNQWNSSTGIAIDMDPMAVPSGALTVGATTTQLRMSSGNDFVLLSSFILESQIQAADIAVNKSVDNPEPDPGDTVTYTVTATNNGVNTSTGVQVTDVVPAGLTFTSASTTQGTYASGTGIWDVGTLANGASGTLTITATVNAGTVGDTIVNTATKTGGSGFDVDATNNSATATLTVRGADLEVTKAVDNATPNPGDTITYTIVVTNNGPTDTTGVAITDALPAGLSLVSASTTNGPYVGSAWTVGALTAGASATLTIIATVDAGTAGSDIINTASVAGNDLVDPVAGNNSDSVQLWVPLVDIVLTKAASTATPLPGDTFTYTVTATNNGPDTATGVTVDDVIPAGLTLTGASATQGSYTGDTWTIGSLASGSTETITFTVSVPNGSTGGVVTNAAVVSGVNETESTTANNSASAMVTIAQSDITVTKTVDVAAPNPGDTITYTVIVSNGGPDAATGVTVVDPLPAGVTETGSSTIQGAYADPTWTVGTLVSGASATLTITATVDAGTEGTTQTNTATGSSDQADPDPSNNSDGANITVPAVDVAVTKTVNNSAPNPSDTITYTVSVTNNGPDTATAVAIADTVPSGVTLVSASPSQGSYASGIWTVGTITNGGVETLTMVATVDAGTAGSTITNTASLLSVTETDTDSSNDAASAGIGVPAVDLALTKTVSAPNPSPGQTVTYTVTVTNNGPDPATGITITDNVPAGLIVTGSSVTQGSFVGSVWSLGGLASGSGATLTISATISSGAAGTDVTNTASVGGVTETDIDLSNDSDSASFAVPAVDIAVTKTVSNSVPNPGDTVTYVVTVTNNGPDTATGISVNDTLPAEVSLDTAGATQGSYIAPNWTVGSLVSGASATLTISTTVLPSAAGSAVTNTATVVGVDQADTDATNNSASASFAAPAIDVAVTKTVDQPVANPGDTVTYIVVVTNNGPNDATGVAITDSLPTGVTLISVSATAGSYVDPTWTVGDLASGSSETLTIAATIDTGTAGTTITNTASVAASTETDIDPSNDSASASVVIPSTDLAITKTVDDANPLPGDTITFTVSVTNGGPSAATGISISDPLPAGITLASATPSQGSYTDPTWTVGGLGNGATATLTIVATVNAGTPGTSISNTATVTSLNETDPDSSNNSATSTIYVSAVDLAVTKTASTALAQVGDAVSYTVTVTNNGPDTAGGVTINDSVPSGVTLVSAFFSQGSYAAGVWTVGTLTNGATETLILNVTVDPASAGSVVTNTASVGSVGETDTDPANDSDSAVFGVLAVDIDVTKTVDNPTPVPGATVTYTVTATNAGPSPASGVTITDALPGGVTLVSATPSQGSYAGSTWTTGTLGIADSAMLTIVATVDLGTAGTTIINTASVAGVNEYDLDTSNDADSAAIVVSAVDLSVTKTVDDTAPNPGDTVTYTVQVTNGGPDTATGLALTDALPPGVTLVSATTTQGSYAAPVWTVGVLPSGSTVTLTIVADVDAGTEGSTIVNTAAVSSLNEADTNPGNNSAIAAINVPAVDLSITKIVDVATANPGDTVRFTITAANAGPDTATGVQISDALPLGMTLVSATPSQGSYVGSTWFVGGLANGATETLIIVTTIDAGTAGTSTINTASTVGVNETDTDPTNNSDSATVTVNAVDIEISKTVNDATPNVGDVVTYLVTVANNGPDTATGVTISEPLPTGLTLVSASPSQGTVAGLLWTVGSLVSGASASLSIVATVDAGTGGNTMTNTASLSGVTEADTNPSNDDASVSLTPQSVDLSIDKVVDIANATPGDTVTFTVTLANNGPDTGTGIVVNDVLPTGLTPVSVTPSVGTWIAPQWTVPSLPSAATATLVVVATIDLGLWNQTFTNTATVTTSDQEDPDPANDSDDAIVSTAPSADLTVTKSVDNVSPDAGDTITYTITVANDGPDDEPAVLVTDSLPAGITYVSTSASVGTYDDTTGVWSVGSLPNAATETLTIVAVVGTGFGRVTITNVASVSGTLVDTEPANDVAAVDITPTLVDVEITKTAPATATAGSIFDYEIIVSNNFPDIASGVSVTDVLPSGITYIGSAASIGSYDPGTGVWTVGDLSSAAAATLRINVTVDNGATGDVVNTASVSVSGPEDADPGNNSSTVTTTVLVPPVANDDVATTPFETPVIVLILGNDTDADGTIDPTSVTVTIDPATGAVTVDPVTGALTYAPNAEFSGADFFEYSVCDNDGLCDTASVFATIDPENDAPYPFIRDGDGDPSPVGVITYTIAIGETPDPLPLMDPNDDNIISLVITDGVLPPVLSINPDGSFSGTATTIGTYTVQIEICDDGTPQRCSLFSVTIRVGETLPYTGLEVVGFIRLGLMFILGGAILLVLAWKREEEESRDGNAPRVS